MTASESDSIQQEVVEYLDSMPPPPATWTPAVGPEALSIMGQLRAAKFKEDEIRNVRNEAVAILSRSVNPKAPDNPRVNTGLAIGFVQSGKTTSFNLLTALAADNNIPLVIVLAGTTKPLFAQSEERFEEALRIRDRGPIQQRWMRVSNPRKADRAKIQAELAKWVDEDVPIDERKVTLLMVMKNHNHIRNLNQVLDGLSEETVDLPALVIDDEADQAGLNTLVKQDEQSTTYRHILGLRERLPWHTYVQYTATPQAPLLISVIDILSPDFPVVLSPGSAYTGGDQFFGEGRSRVVRHIPVEDILDQGDPVEEVPQSLLEALRVFFLGVTAGWALAKAEPGASHAKNRSMMVHPSQRVDPHDEYGAWIDAARGEWIAALKDKNHPKHDEVVEGFFNAWKDLKSTASDIPSFEILLPQLRFRIADTIVLKMNAKGGKTPTPEWGSHYAHILVGGQAMDRGFTVEGLTVTYMPRGPGQGNADTVQQRGRFFGYKRSYLGYCRVYLEAETEVLFRNYVDHEQHMHRQMQEIMAEGKSLKDWKRAFIMDPKMKPTRRNVLDRGLLHGNFAGHWWYPKAPHDKAESIGNNRAVFQEFIAQHAWQEFRIHPDVAKGSVHHVARGLDVRKVMEQLLARLEVPRANDNLSYTALLMQLQHQLDNLPDGHEPPPCSVYHMSPDEIRTRSVDPAKDILNEIFRGPSDGTGNAIYPGDRYTHREEEVSIQLHFLTLKFADGSTLQNVPEIAIWLPRSMSQSLVVQELGAA